MRPRVSVCLRVYNGEPYLAHAISSVLGQSYRNFELVIVDDGSTDGTPEVIASFHDERIVLIRQENRGLTRATQRAVDEARGTYVAIMDADDIADPYRLATQVRAFEADPDLVAVGSNVTIIDEAGRAIAERRYPCDDASIRRALPSYNPFAHPTMMFRTIALRSCGSYSQRFRTVEDYELYFRLLRHGTAMNVTRNLLQYRVHRGSIKSSRTKLQLLETIALRRLAALEYGYPISLTSRATTLGQRALVKLPSAAIVALFERTAYRPVRARA